MKPLEIIGLPYRLGAVPDIHKAGDCYTITTVSYTHLTLPTKA